MNIPAKILLTVAYTIGLIYVATFFSVDFFRWYTNNIISYEQQNLMLAVITYPTLIYLIYRFWSFKNIDNSTKGIWTFILLFFGVIKIPIYVWKADDDLVRRHQKITLHNNRKHK